MTLKDVRNWVLGPSGQHAAPFAVWLLFIAAAGEPTAWKYALRTGVCAALLLWARPWRWYPVLCRGNLGLALLAGSVVFALWVLPELPVVTQQWPFAAELYARFGIMPLGRLPVFPDPSPYAPEVCGWTLTLTRLVGSAVVIAVIEEFFWRGFLYRWFLHRDFLAESLAHVDWPAFFIVCVVFGLEHDRWAVGMLAGAVYGWLTIRTGDIWAAVVAHVTTNLLLGVYVISGGVYRFW